MHEITATVYGVKKKTTQSNRRSALRKLRMAVEPYVVYAGATPPPRVIVWTESLTRGQEEP